MHSIYGCTFDALPFDQLGTRSVLTHLFPKFSATVRQGSLAPVVGLPAPSSLLDRSTGRDLGDFKTSHLSHVTWLASISRPQSISRGITPRPGCFIACCLLTESSFCLTVKKLKRCEISEHYQTILMRLNNFIQLKETTALLVFLFYKSYICCSLHYMCVVLMCVLYSRRTLTMAHLHQHDFLMSPLGGVVGLRGATSLGAHNPNDFDNIWTYNANEW